MKNNNEKDLQQKEKIQEPVRKVDLSRLPTFADSGKGGKGVDWHGSIGMKVPFIYKDVKGEIEIIDYDRKGNLSVCYNGEISNIHIANFQACKIGNIIGKMKRGFSYKVGDIIESYNNVTKVDCKIEILECFYKEVLRVGKKTNIRFYRYKCINDGYIGTVNEDHIRKGASCPVCGGQKIIAGINDILTTHPHIEKFIANKEDGLMYGSGSNKKIDVKCPNCKKTKKMKIRDLTMKEKVTCDFCGDGYSYSEKFVACILNELNVSFVKEKIFNWSGKRRYDFYLKKYNCIIEVHGLQHFVESFSRIGGRTLEEEKMNDLEKKNIALQNGISHYIEIDAKYSDKDYLVNSIRQSGLEEIIGKSIDKINWQKCHEFACTSNMVDVWNMWNDGIKDITIICEKMDMSKDTIIRYLKQGAKANMCDYIGKKDEDSANSQIICDLWNNGVKNIQKISKLTNVKESSVIHFLTKADKKGLCNYRYDMDNKIQVYKDGELVLSHKSAKHIEMLSEDILGVKLLQNTILDVCHGRKKEYKGYVIKDIRKESV